MTSLVGVSTSTLEASVGVVTISLGRQCADLVSDATAIFKVIYGIDDGNNYGRYFAGQNPLASFVISATSVAAMIAQGVTQRTIVLEAIEAAGAASSGNPQDYAAAIVSLIEAVRQACASPADAVRILEELVVFAESVSGGADAIGGQINVLASASAVLIRRVSAFSLAIASAAYVPTSQQDAEAVRDDIADLIDTVATEAGDRFEDNSYHALNSTRVAVVRDLTSRGADLAPVVTRSFGENLPACVLAYRLYQDATRADDLVARNNPPDPSFMPRMIEALAF